MACLLRLWRRWRRRNVVDVSAGESGSTSTTSSHAVDSSIFAASTSPEAPAAEVRPEQDTAHLSPADEGPSSSGHTQPEEEPPFRPPSPYELACRGLPNLGQTCFMNAAVQAILSLNPFIEEFCLQVGVAATSSTVRLFGQLVGLRFSDDIDEKREVLEALKHTVAQYDPSFDDDGPNDTFCFLMSVLNMLDFVSQDLQRAAGALGLSYTCPVAAHIAFSTLNTTTCCRCGMQSSTYHKWLSFGVELIWSPVHSVEQGLEQYLQGFERFRVCSCGHDRAFVQLSFVHLPTILIIMLSRFVAINGQTFKLRFPVEVSRELVISSSEHETARYSLITTISHLGPTAAYGHAVCDSVYNAEQDVWVCYSDYHSYVTSGTFLCQARMHDAYVVFYEKQS